MTKNRKLTPQEIMICNKSLERFKDELSYNEYQVKICDLKLETGLKIEYMKNVRDYKTLKKEFSEQAKICKDQINILQDQIRNGVEIKKEIKEENDGKRLD